jgi:dipeptidyl aminopeptidase/acylaminoacyl peptidase
MTSGVVMHTIGAFILTAFCLVSPAQAEDYLSLEEVVGLNRVISVAMSPAGDRIAYLKSVPRELYVDADGPAYVELHIVDLEGNSTPYVTGDIEITAYAWAPDGESIFFVAKRDTEAEFNSLFRISVAGGEAETVFSHVSDIIGVFPSPEGESIAFTAADALPDKTTQLVEKGFKALVFEESVPEIHVWLLDLDTLETARHDLPGSVHHFDWSDDGSRYAVGLAPDPLVDSSYTSQDIHVVDAATGEVLNQVGSVGKLGHFEISPDGERIAYIGSVDEHDPQNGRLYVTSVSGGERRDLVPNYMGHVNAFTWIDDVSVRWAGARGVYTEVHTANTGSTREVGEAIDEGVILLAMDAGAGQEAFAAVAESPEHPPEVFYVRDDEKPVRLTDSNPVLAARTAVRQEVITYEARDGLDLQAILIHPAEKEPGGNPAVFLVHGGPESHVANGWISSYSRPAHALAREGYLVALPNYRGSTGRGVEFSKLGQNDYADAEFNDIVDLKRHLVEEGLIDGERVGISGGSYGGYATMWSASALSDEYAAAVAFVGISNQISKFGTTDIPVEMYLVHSRVWPWEDWMRLLERSPVFHADKTKTPLLIMHGDSDPRVHPQQSLEMYRNVKLRTDTPVRLVYYPDEGHGNRATAAQYDYGLRFIRWMNHYLKGPGGAPPPYELDHASRLESAQ